MKNKIPFVIKTWASSDAPHDFQYISKSIPSLLKSKLPEDVEIIIYDDHSTDERLIDFLKAISRQDKRVRVLFSDINRGPNWAQEYIFSKIIDEYNSPFFLTLDDDVIYHSDWYVKLIESFRKCSEIGVRGIFTALNMPFRLPCAELSIDNNKYLLKWKQPALNWLVPMDIYKDVGPFKDEGIAYDTIYSHWLRLKHYPIICLVPSYVQNIGMFGAYCKGQAVTVAIDFVEDDIFKRCIGRVSRNITEFHQKIKRITGCSTRIIAPIRWGNEFVYEGVSKDGQILALCNPYDQIKLGWNLEEIEDRCIQVMSVQEFTPVMLYNLPKNLKRKLTCVEYKWKFMPTIREHKNLKLGVWPIDFRGFFIEIIKQLIPFHAKGIVHNKIRLENIYVDSINNRYYLAWYGTELPPNKKFDDYSMLIKYFGGCVSRWAKKETREMFTVRYIETVAPELLNGASPSLNSDIFSAAMLVYVLASEEIFSLSDLETNKRKWINGNIPNILKRQDETFLRILKKCISFNPKDRFQTAMEVYKQFGN